MPSTQPTPELLAQYQRLYDTCEVRPNHLRHAQDAAGRIRTQEERYGQVQLWTGVPWWWIALVHHMESGGSFNRHLHNGDPLTGRTVHVPAGRPAKGEPPFNWEVSADDALRLRRLHEVKDWSLPAALYQLEGYNGWGYRKYHTETLSPYLWSGTQHYVRGKYVADGKWYPRAVSLQTGACAVLKLLNLFP